MPDSRGNAVDRITASRIRSLDGVPSDSSNAAARSVFTWPVRVYYEDTDAGGIVYHASYLRFFERARTEWLRALGGPSQHDRARERDEVFVVHSLAIEYLRPARLDDMLRTELSIVEARRASMTLRQRACSEAGDVLADARVRLAMVRRRDGRPVPLPAPLLSFTQTGTAP